MQADSHQLEPKTAGRRRVLAGVLGEALVMAVVGGALALAANAISPAGLSLTRDYFPAASSAPAPVAAAATSPSVPSTNAAPTPLVAAPSVKINANGLQLIDGSRALEMFNDPRRQLDIVMFVDARDEEHFGEGHIPGAFNFDHFRPEKQLPAVLPVCRAAEQIVVYCTGGECGDSIEAAVALRDLGISNDRLFVFTGGITEWTTNGLSVETGARNSGTMRPAKK